MLRMPFDELLNFFSELVKSELFLIPDDLKVLSNLGFIK
jgi:hypothetical protein